MSNIGEYYYTLRHLHLKRRYGQWTARIDPAQVAYIHMSKEWPKHMKKWRFFVCPGNWDLSERRYVPFRLEQMKQLFVDQMPYRETDTYKMMLRELRSDGTTRSPQLKSENEIDHYFRGIESLFNSMRNEGYKIRDADSVRRDKEITVRIGRNGQLIKANEGTHRWAIAILLELPSVPVVVDLVHPRWVMRCRDEYGGSAVSAIRGGLDALGAK